MNKKIIKFLSFFIFKSEKRKKFRRILNSILFQIEQEELESKKEKTRQNLEEEKYNPRKVYVIDDYKTINNVKFSKDIPNGLISETFVRRDYENGGLKDAVFVDVGSCIGDLALFSAQNNNIKAVYSFEPFEETFEKAVKNINLNPELKEKIKIYNYGLGNESKELEVTIYKDDPIANSTNEFFKEKINKVSNDIVKVKIRKSSDVLKEIIKENPNSPIILKMDIEGSEFDCFDDIEKNNLFEKIDMIIVEWHYKDYKILTNLFEKFGFVWFNEYFSDVYGLIRAVKVHK